MAPCTFSKLMFYYFKLQITNFKIQVLYSVIYTCKKSWLTMKMSAYYKNVGALPIWLRFNKMSALYWNVSALLKCWRFLEMLALYWNVGALLKCWCTIEMLVPHVTSHVKIYNSCTVWPSPYCLAWQNFQSDYSSSVLAGGSFSPLEGVDPRSL